MRSLRRVDPLRLLAWSLIATGATLGLLIALLISAYRGRLPSHSLQWGIGAVTALVPLLGAAWVSVFARLRAQREELPQALFESSPLAIKLVDREGRVRSWNAAAERLLGWSSADALGLLLPGVPDDRREETGGLIARAFDGEPSRSLRSECVRRDGARVAVNVSAARLPDLRFPDDSVMLVMEDVSEQVRLENELRQAQKMEAIGRLAGGVAHDFNNVLTSILGYCDLIEQECAERSDVREDVRHIRHAGERAAALTQQMLAFSRRQMLQPLVVDVNELLAGIEDMLRRLLGEDVELRVIRASGLWRVRVDPHQLEQVVINLAANARDAMPGGGKLTIETANKVLPESYPMTESEGGPGPHVMLAATDTGHGMDARTKARVFEPFFTTKPQGRGTGLGLSSVFGVVKQSRGHINVYSEPGIGTTFRLYLPIVDGPLDAAPARAGGAARGGSETVLFVEDDESVRRMTTRLLEEAGYTVHAAMDPESALALFEAHKDRIRLLVTDAVLPRKTGRQLAREIREKAPELPVLYLSGYTDNVIVHHGILDEGIDFLHKPFQFEHFLAEVRRLLDGRTARPD